MILAWTAFVVFVLWLSGWRREYRGVSFMNNGIKDVKLRKVWVWRGYFE